jgi:hypothetical protein
MTKMRATVWFTGDSFVPLGFIDLVDWPSGSSESCPSGQVDASTGVIMDYGYALIRSGSDFTDWETFEDFLDQIYSKRDVFEEWKIEDVEIHLDVIDDGQCNFQFDADILRKVVDMKACLTVTCWRDH